MAIKHVPRVSVKVEYGKVKNKITSVKFEAKNASGIYEETYASWSGVRTASYPNSLSTPSRGANPFIVGLTKVGTGATFTASTNGYDGYASKVATSEVWYDEYEKHLGYKIPNDGLRITVTSSENIEMLTLYFDKFSNAYPVRMTLDYGTYHEDVDNYSPRMFAFKLDGSSNVAVITLLSWSQPNSIVRLTGLLDGLEETYDRSNNLQRVSVKMQSTASDLPEYGCIGKTDSIALYDNDYQIRQLAERGFLNKGLPISVYVNNNLVSSYSSSADWNENGKEISVSMEDEIMNWDAIQLDLAEPPRVYVGVNTFSENRADNLWELLISTLKIAGVEVDMGGEYLGRLEVSTATVTHLKNIRLGIWYQPEQLNLSEFVNNICTLGQINIYIGFGDKIVISKI